MTNGSKLLDYIFIILAIVLGAGSVFLMALGGTFAKVIFGWSESKILLWDTFLSFIFFIQHSVMVRKFFRDRVKMAFPVQYDGAIYAITSGIALAIVVIFWQRSNIYFFVLQGIPRLIATMCFILGALLFILGASRLKPFDPLGIGPIRAHLRNIKYQPGPFIIRGPYRLVRHPLYACALIMFWANPDLSLDQLLFNVLWTGWVFIATLLEERDLIHEFGDVYLEYKKNVPMFVPWKISHLIKNQSAK